MKNKSLNRPIFTKPRGVIFDPTESILEKMSRLEDQIFDLGLYQKVVNEELTQSCLKMEQKIAEQAKVIEKLLGLLEVEALKKSDCNSFWESVTVFEQDHYRE